MLAVRACHAGSPTDPGQSQITGFQLPEPPCSPQTLFADICFLASFPRGYFFPSPKNVTLPPPAQELLPTLLSPSQILCTPSTGAFWGFPTPPTRGNGGLFPTPLNPWLHLPASDGTGNPQFCFTGALHSPNTQMLKDRLFL